MSTTDTSPPASAASATARAAGSPRVPRRRRRWVWVSAALLVLGGVAGNMALTAHLADRAPMLVLARDVAWGQRLSEADVSAVDLPADVRQFAVPESRRRHVLGLVAGHTLHAGQLLGPGDLTPQVIPGPGQRVVGVRLKPGRYPARGLAPNDPVVVHPAPEEATGSPVAVGADFRARVVRCSAPDAEGAITVDLLVPEATGPAAVAAAVQGAQVSVLGPPQ